MTAFEFYNQEKKQQEEQLKKANDQLNISSIIRLIVFLGAAFGIYYFLDTWKVAVLIALIAFILFLFLVSRHTNLQQKRDKRQELVKINELELQVLRRDYFQLPTGEKYDDPLHPYSQDIDLFGRGSFFQYLNRTALKGGKDRLAFLLKENSLEEIGEKQLMVQELAEKVKWRQEFSAVAALIKTETSSDAVLSWFRNYERFVPAFMKWFPYLFSAISTIILVLYFLDQVEGLYVFLWLLLGLLITGIFIKKVNRLSGNVDKVQDTFNQYHRLLALMENTQFSSSILQSFQQQIKLENKKASEIFKEFSKAIDALDQRSNFLIGFLLNGFLLWDMQQSYKLEKWILKYSQNVEKWFEVIELTDAYNSLGNFAFNHQQYVYPTIKYQENIIEASQLAHPLLDPKKRIANDFILKDEHFFIITGANMAGKSTFLRTVSLQIVMSNIGLPVCAKTCSYHPIKLITSMRTTDSLSDDESYFFSELKRLQFIVNQIKNDKYFIILDEILKGTNSTDKAIGSKKFIQKLIKSRSTGIIATHDLSLCEVSEELPQVKNYYFDAEIIDDELHFDYRFKTGVCQNMNASFLLKKMQIVD